MKIKWQKVLSAIMVIVFLMSMTVSYVPAAAATAFSVDTLIEAEKTTLGKSITVTKDKNASDGKYISASGEMKDPDAITNPDVTIDFNVPADGTYAVYAKVIITSGGNDSYFFRFNEDGWKDMHPGELGSDYVWLKLAESELKSGKNIFMWNHREQGAIYDAFFITADASKVPKIDGSASATSPSTSSPKPSSVSSKIKEYTLTDGSVMFEAEENVTSKTVETVSDDKASGKKAVRLSVDDREIPADDADGGISFTFKPEKQTSYKVWVRMLCPGTGSDSCWLSTGSSFAQTGLEVSSDYVWSVFTMIIPYSLDPITVKIIPRETGAMIDKFIITDHSLFIPKDMGSLPQKGDIVISKLPSDVYPMPTITPPPGHPRVMLRKSDIPKIKENWNSEENAAAVAEFEKLLAMKTDGIVKPSKTGATFDTKVLGAIEAMAFDYVINGNEENGKQAIIAMKNFCGNANFIGEFDPTRSAGQLIYVSSLVYDWCYPLMTQEDKKLFVSYCQANASTMEIGWPPKRQGAVCGHGSEAQLMRDLLSFGIATYDEYPDIYNYVGGRYLSEYLKPRNYWASANTQHQGMAYSSYRRTADLLGQWLMYRMTGEAVFVSEFGKADYQWIYSRRPDGEMLREGDDYNEANNTCTYWNAYCDPLFYSASFYKDPYSKKEFLKERSQLATFNYTQQFFTPVTVLLFNDPTIVPKHVATLPKTKYFASPLGQMIARTGWNDGVNAPDAIAFMKIGEVYGANHNHRDAGNFQIYYKGILASESGIYDSYGTEHDYNYNKRSIAHNTLLIYDPDEKDANRANDGGQRAPSNWGEPATYEQWIESGEFETGEVLAHEFGPDTITPEYSYISGDIAKAYTNKVSEVRRSMLFMPNDNPDFPATFIVFDKVTAKKKSFKKTFLLHSQEEIKVNGNVSVLTDTNDGHNGMLTNQTLLPKNANLETIGGEDKRFWIDGKNYEPTKMPLTYEVGWGRLEVSPSEENKTDYFLNVMYVNDADKNYELQRAELIESDKLYGAKILGKAALFGKDKERVTDSASFTVPGDETELKITVAGIKEGTWSVSVGGNELTKEIASKDGGMIYFTGPAGEYTLTYAGTNADKTFTETPVADFERIDIKVNDSYIYSDVPARIIDDRTLVPMRAIFEALGATLTYDDATATATANYNDDVEIKLTENSSTAYVDGEAMELDVPAMIIDDRFMVPVRFVSETLGATVTWDKFAKSVLIKKGKPKPKPISWEGYANIINSTCSEYSAENYPSNTYDGDTNTVWSAQGEHWINYEFDKEYTITDVELWLNPNGGRTAFFDIWTSEDGQNWTMVYEGNGKEGNPDKWEIFTLKTPVKTKYMRYYAHGSNISMWNAVKEIRFKVAE